MTPASCRSRRSNVDKKAACSLGASVSAFVEVRRFSALIAPSGCAGDSTTVLNCLSSYCFSVSEVVLRRTARQRHSAREIVAKPRQADVLLRRVQTGADVARVLSVMETGQRDGPDLKQPAPSPKTNEAPTE